MSTPASPRFMLVMFDLDGTLVETAPEIFDAVNDTLRELLLPPVSQQQVNDWIGHGTRELLIQALAWSRQLPVAQVRDSADLPLALHEFDRNYQRRCGTRSELYPHVREVLESLRRDDVKLAVVTNKEGRYTQVVLDVHGLTPLFDMVISGDTLSRKKPDPAGVHHCLARFGVPASLALFVGDSSIDIATAKAAQVEVWALPYGYNMGQRIEDSGADRVIATVRDILS